MAVHRRRADHGAAGARQRSPAIPDDAAAFAGAKPALMRRHLETLVLVGELREAEGGQAVAQPA